MILGVGIVAYQQANKSQSFYEESASLYKFPSEGIKFGSVERIKWHDLSQVKNIKNNNNLIGQGIPQVGYTYSF